MRDAGGELDVLEAARDLARRVGEHLAVLGGDDRGQLVGALCSSSRKEEHWESEDVRQSRAAATAVLTAALDLGR